MRSIGRGQSSSTTVPVLTLFTPNADGVLADPASVSFEIWNVVNAASPSRVAGPTAATKVSTGYYLAPWVVAADAPIGRYEARWSWQFTGGAVQTATDLLEVLTAVRAPLTPVYALVSDLRDEGLDAARVNDERARAAIIRATQLVDLYTRHRFAARLATLRVDGRGGQTLVLPEPVAAVERIDVGESGSNLQEIDLADVTIANRHLAGIDTPDDRVFPRIDWKSSYSIGGSQYTHRASLSAYAFWKPGVQNVRVTGVFGFTDPVAGGPPVGETPDAIRRVAMLLALREAPKMVTDADEREDAQRRARITSESTDGQSYGLASPPSLGQVSQWTGDPEIDNVLARYTRVSNMRAA